MCSRISRGNSIKQDFAGRELLLVVVPVVVVIGGGGGRGGGGGGGRLAGSSWPEHD